tara:strand:+ start:392 stop:736 length:345 start_codon:yes stop_codon:yes gene_type:complete
MSKIKIIAFLILGFIVYKVFVTVKDFEVGLDKRIEKVEALGLGEQDNVIGLMMYLGDPEDLVLVEHLLVKNKSKCLEMKENAEEVSNAYYECARINAIVKEGKIVTVIEELEVL